MSLSTLINLVNTETELNLFDEYDIQIGSFNRDNVETRYYNCEILYINPYDVGKMYVSIDTSELMIN